MQHAARGKVAAAAWQTETHYTAVVKQLKSTWLVGMLGLCPDHVQDVMYTPSSKSKQGHTVTMLTGLRPYLLGASRTLPIDVHEFAVCSASL